MHFFRCVIGFVAYLKNHILVGRITRLKKYQITSESVLMSNVGIIDAAELLMLLLNPSQFQFGRFSFHFCKKKKTNKINKLRSQKVIFILKSQTQLLHSRYDNVENWPPLKAIRRNVSMVFLYTHTTIGTPRSYAPNMIEVGDMQI